MPLKWRETPVLSTWRYGVPGYDVVTVRAVSVHRMGMAAPERVGPNRTPVESCAQTGAATWAGAHGCGRSAGFGGRPTQASQPVCRHRIGGSSCDRASRSWLAPESTEYRTGAQVDAGAVDIGSNQDRGILVLTRSRDYGTADREERLDAEVQRLEKEAGDLQRYVQRVEPEPVPLPQVGPICPATLTTG